MADLGFLFDPSTVSRPCEYGDFPDLPAIRSMQAKRQWVVWRYEDHGKPKLDKVPYQPSTGFGASVSRPHNWGTYDQAVARARRGHSDGGTFNGVGLVLAEQDGFTGIDLDNCRDPHTGELSPLAQEVVNLAETYCEVTPSETGLRLIAEGKIPAALKRDPIGVEMYGKGRYLTITGWHVEGTPTEIRPAGKTIALLRAAVDRFDAELAAKRAVEAPKPSGDGMVSAALPTREEGGSPYFRNVNSAALANLSAWVPALFGSSARFQPGTQAYRVSSRSLGRQLEEDLSIAPNGIRDWGVADMGDARLGARTPIDLVMQFGEEREPIGAAGWLCRQMGRAPEDFGWQADDGRGAEAAAALLARKVQREDDGTLIDAETGEVLPEKKGGQGAFLDALTLGRGIDWSEGSGLISEIADWIMSSARRPNRPLAVAAATAVISGTCGRHLYAPGGTALNLYIVCLAGTTVGKGRPFSAVAEILKAAGLGMIQTTAKGFSVSSIEQMIVDHPACVATIDEIGANLLGRMSNRNSNTHEQAMRGALLELWSREQGQDSFYTHRRANAAPIEVPCPSLTIFGASTSEAFYGAVTSGSIRDGFLNRFLLAHAAPRGKSREVPPEAKTVPPQIIRALQSIPPNGDGNLQVALGNFTLSVKPVEKRMEWDSQATADRAAQFEEEILDLMDANPEHASLMGRTFEYTVRLAAISAVSRGGRKERVRLSDLEWAAAWAISSAKAMIDGAGAQMAASDYEQKFNAVRNAIETSGMLTRQDLLRRVRSVSAREREDIIKHLKEGGWIEDVSVPTKGRHAAGWRWVG